MGTTALRQLLKSLCKNSHWKYAVFWKLKHENPMILTWEDGYCDYLKPRESTQTASGGIYFNDGFDIISSNCETSISDSTSGSYPIGLAVADMSSLQYALGEGAVGKVAVTGNHCWISSDNIFAGELNSKSVPEHPDEWLLQFASGIKTVLLIPALPHGVLQLGSLEMVVEDAAEVTHLKAKFNTLQNNIGNTAHFTLNTDFQAQLSSSSLPLSSVAKNIEEQSAISNMLASKLEFKDLNNIEDVKPSKHKLSSPFNIGPLYITNSMPEAHGEGLPAEILGSANDSGVQPIVFTEKSSPLDQSTYASPDMVVSHLFTMSCLEEELQAFSHYNASRESSNQIMNSYSDRHMGEQPFADMDVNNIGYQNVSNFLNFPIDSELHKALGPAFPEQKNEYLWDSFISVDGTNSISYSICDRNLIDGIGPPLLSKGCDPEYLFDAMVDNVNSSLNGTSSKHSESPRVGSPLGQFGFSSRPQSQSKVSASGDDSVAQSNVTDAFAFRDRNAFTNSSTSHSLESMMSTLINEQPKKGCNDVKPRKGAKLTSNKRRVKSGDSQKPRPRDRQMIQDRVKELRELVPDGSKCSIDGLLDKTIKHMLFLTSMTDRAEKLTEWAQREDTDLRRSHGTKNGCQNGTSWAVEFDSELQMCPIVVEDLEYPGHMLIEMLCDDHGVFLEIAQVIGGLELTILKGTMETHSNSTWAHFIVEASKDFHRMDIFWPLMQFLQRKRTISSKI